MNPDFQSLDKTNCLFWDCPVRKIPKHGSLGIEVFISKYCNLYLEAFDPSIEELYMQSEFNDSYHNSALNEKQVVGEFRPGKTQTGLLNCKYSVLRKKFSH